MCSESGVYAIYEKWSQIVVIVNEVWGREEEEASGGEQAEMRHLHLMPPPRFKSGLSLPIDSLHSFHLIHLPPVQLFSSNPFLSFA